MVGQEEFLTKEEWAKVVKRHLGTNQFEVLSISLRRLSEGGGFLGEHRHAEVGVRLRDEPHTRRALHFFVKGQPQALPEQRALVEETGTFTKEVAVLSKLFVHLRSVLENGGEDMKWCCKCYYTRPDVIVFEDVSPLGFRVLDRAVKFGFQHCTTVLKALANLHAASLIFEEKHPAPGYRVTADYEADLKEPFFLLRPGHPGTLWLESGVRVMWKLVEEIRGADALQKMKTQIQEVMYTFFDLVKTSDRYRNVVSHGDMWRNNIFFRLEEGEPVEALMCDYQITRYTPPANDVTCFLYLGTSRAFREEHYPQLLEFYHDQLSQNLRRHDIQPDSVLSWEEFKNSCEHYKPMGAMITCLYSVITFLSNDDLKPVMESSKDYERFVKQDRIPETMHAFKNDTLYREKLSEVVEEFIEVCIEKK
ncbi:hypothetical protein R5R35_014335 [Gryllus longicercus]|uniref:CHK kinase-like domain-containing protein n=1 Tax=Gryllus longicercus TaxID=2509291 RepID=A0AAN9VDZ2_9ORTH